jgi:hypothetical protein
MDTRRSCDGAWVVVSPGEIDVRGTSPAQVRPREARDPGNPASADVAHPSVHPGTTQNLDAPLHHQARAAKQPAISASAANG